MAVSSRKSTVQVAFEVDGQGNVTRAFLASEEAAKRAGKGLDDYSKAGERAEQVQQRLNLAAAAAGSILGGVLVTGLALIARNTIAAQKEQAQLEAVLRSTGNAAGYNAEQLNKMAASISASSLFSAGEITDAQTRLLSYSGIVGEKFPQALQVAIDQAQRLGISVTQSAEIVGRALESPTKAAAALAQQGFGAAFTDAVRDSIKALEQAGREADAQQIIIDILNESYQDAASAARDTFGGALVALKNTINDLLTGSDGSLDGLQGSIDTLIETLNSPDVRSGFAAIADGAIWTANSFGVLVGEIGRAYNAAQQWLTLKMGGNRSMGGENLAEQRRELAGLEADLARMQGDSYIRAISAGRIQKLEDRIAEVRETVAMNEMLFGDPGAAQIRWITPDSTSEDRHLQQPGVTGIPDWVDPKDAAKAAAAARKAAAAAARDQAEAERELARQQREAAEAAADFTRTQDDALAMLEDLRAEMEGPTAQVMLEYMRMERELDFLFAGGALTAEQYAEAMELVYQARNRALGDIARQTKEAADSMTVYADQAARNMQSAFADFLFDPFEDGLSGMLQSFSETLQRMYAEYLASEIFRSFMGGMDSSGNNWGSIIDLFSGGSGFGFAKGGAIQGSDSLSAYSGSVVDKPTAFMFAKGGAVGVMGEVPGEAEGIFPLKRGRDGKLGVAAEISGGGGGTVVEIHNYGNEQARAESSHTDDGRELIQVFIGEAARNVATGGALAGAIEGAYGVQRGGVR